MNQKYLATNTIDSELCFTVNCIMVKVFKIEYFRLIYMFHIFIKIKSQ